MRIVVCVKQVPDTQDLRLDDRGYVVRQGVPTIINPYDEYGLEEGIRLKERLGEATVTALTMGPEHAEEALREAIARGADEAVLLTDERLAGADVLATARALAGAVRKLEDVGLVICGKQSSDGVTGILPGMLAEELDWPLATLVRSLTELDTDAGTLVAERIVEGGAEVLEAPLPAVVSVVKEINEPRLSSLKGIMRAKRTTITTWNASDLGLEPDRVGELGSRTSVKRVWQPERSHDVQLFGGSPDEQAREFVGVLRQLRLL